MIGPALSVVRDAGKESTPPTGAGAVLIGFAGDGAEGGAGGDEAVFVAGDFGVKTGFAAGVFGVYAADAVAVLAAAAVAVGVVVLAALVFVAVDFAEARVVLAAGFAVALAVVAVAVAVDFVVMALGVAFVVSLAVETFAVVTFVVVALGVDFAMALAVVFGVEAVVACRTRSWACSSANVLGTLQCRKVARQAILLCGRRKRGIWAERDAMLDSRSD